MNTKLLKQKILDLAIRGKLTQQLKSDGNTADLLKEISSTCHPERSANGAKSKDPGAIIPLDKSEAPFEIPANWEWVRLGDLCELQSGFTIPQDQEVEYGRMMYIKVSDMNLPENFYEIKKSQRYVNQWKESQVIKANSIIFPKRGGALLTNKKRIVKESILADLNIMGITPKACFDYIYWWFKNIDLGTLNNGSNIPQVNNKDISPLPIPLPPLAEQQRIVAKIEEAFAEIEAIEKNKELLKTHIKQARQKILDLAIHGKLVPQNKTDEPASVLLERITHDNPHYEKIEDEPFEIPQNWCWTKFGDCINVINGKNQSAVTDPEGHFPIYGSGGIMGRANSYLCPENCTIIGRKGSINNPIFVSEKFWNVDTAFGLCPSGIVLPKYLYFFCLWFDFSTLDNSTTLPSLTKTSIQQIPFVLAPLKEQSRIVAKIEELFSTLDQMERNFV